MINSLISSLLTSYFLFLSVAYGRATGADSDNMINTNTSSALLDSTTGTNSNDVKGLMVLINAYPVLMGERFPLMSNDPCYPHKLIWIRCSSDAVRRVTDLYVGSQYLVGTLPDFSPMDALQAIDFQRNALYGPIPEFLATFPKLTYLDLSYNLFTGSVPYSLANNKKIKLNLAGNKLQLPPPPSSTLFPPPTPTYGYPFLSPSPPYHGGGGGGGGGGSGSGDSSMPDFGGRKKSKLPKVLKITIPPISITAFGGATYGICRCRRRRRRDQHDAAAAQGAR